MIGLTRVSLRVHSEVSSTPPDFVDLIVDAIKSAYLSGIGVEGMSEYEVKSVQIDSTFDAPDPFAVEVELERVGGQFVSKKEMAEIIADCVVSVGGVTSVEFD